MMGILYEVMMYIQYCTAVDSKIVLSVISMNEEYTDLDAVGTNPNNSPRYQHI